jgi:flagellar hook assembly protein FlgD
VSFRIHSPEPNPMRGGTAVRLDLPTPERVSIAVFDAAGRAVRTLASGAQFSTGSHRFSWDGRTDAGLAAPSGLYMVRVVAGARASTLKLTVLR